MIFTLRSKKVIPFPSHRHELQALQDAKRHETTLPWNDGSTFQFSALPKMPRNPRKRTTGKIRTRWSGKNGFKPIKTRRSNTPEANMSDLDTIDTNIEAPEPVKACDRFGLLCFFCKPGALHLSPQESDRSSEDWDQTKAKSRQEAKETNLLSDWDLPKPQPAINQKTDIDGLVLSMLQIGQNDPKVEQVNATELLIPLPTTKAQAEMIEKTNDELTEAKKTDQQEEVKYVMYQRMYIGQVDLLWNRTVVVG